ncbi:uncharacterized protein LOC114516354 [Dendronephthya gigantea]|uniref:uncharacterized protein LOC114516354 n=1 Tax=Dendronephthya gigantea TaxID=151771 RepID=UPI00106B608B|nr:uncharacterized protein LOC114516354 [Dendronephthya gigantea]
MAENRNGESPPPDLPPRLRMNNTPSNRVYEEVSPYASTELGQIHEDINQIESYSESSQSEQASFYETPSSSLQYDPVIYTRRGSRRETGGLPDSYENDYTVIDTTTRRDSYDYSNYYLRTDPGETFKKIHRFKNNPQEFLHVFESTKDEIRTDEETFIIVHLLERSKNKYPTLGGRLDEMAMLACCSSPHVVKKALDTLLHEIFLSISDFSSVRCHNLLKAEEELRSSFLKFLEVDHDKAKTQRMTTYAWLVTFILLKCNDDEFNEIKPKIRAFDKVLEALQTDKEYSERNNFRYGIYLARESIRRIINSSEKKNLSESLKKNIKRCETTLNGQLEDREILKLSKSLADSNWLDLHVCLVFLQDLMKFYQFEGDKKPIILIQMLVGDYRKRCSATRVRTLLRNQKNEQWLFEILVYHVTLRLIRTSTSKAIIEQVLAGHEGCGGILKTTNAIKSISKKNTELLALMHHEKLCQRAVFIADPKIFNQFLTDNCNARGDEKPFIENLSTLQLTSSYKDKIFVILAESRIPMAKNRVITYNCLMSGRKCLLKLHQHSKEELLRSDALKTVPLRNEIQILRILSTNKGSPRNIVQLFGSSIDAPMHMIIERTPKADLLSFLEDLSNPPRASVLHQISQDVCTAMVYLHEHDIIHRDLRAKNCFIFMNEGEIITKLGDFHLAILSYSDPQSPNGIAGRKNSSKSKEDIPNTFALRWLAIEVLQFGEFSRASDVWSFGVLLSEIFTLGCKPYTNMPSGLTLDNENEVHDYVLAGKRLELHPKIPKQIQLLIQYTMMDVDRRPTFSALKGNLMDIVEKNNWDEFYHDPAHYRISHSAESYSSGKFSNPTTGFNVDGCFGDCLNASGIAIPTKVHVDGKLVDCIKEFVPASPDLLKFVEFKHSSLVEVANMAVHNENMEMVTEISDSNLESFINEVGCPLENAKTYLSDIGEGLSYLHKNRFIHRNLRATSVFIFMSGQAKLGCFSRIRRLKPNVLDQSLTVPIDLPIPSGDILRWSSPEVIINGKYSEASDVWAFAVLIWEMFTLIALHDDKELYDEENNKASSLPYHDLKSKEQILSYLEKNRLAQPKNCPEWLYETMELCWEYDANDRPKCADILQSINTEIQSTSEQDLNI